MPKQAPLDAQYILDEAIRLTVKFTRRFTRGSLSMFAFAVFCELPVILVRVFIVAVISTIVNFLHQNPGAPIEGLWIALLPTVWSALALIEPFGTGWWWKQRLGGRSPSQREQLAYSDAVALLQKHTRAPLSLPGMWFVIDTNVPDAAVNGDALMLSRGLLEDDRLPAVLAHELGHLATPDGRLTAALNRLVTPKTFEFDKHRLHYLLTKQGEEQPGTIDAYGMILSGSLKLAMFATGGFGLWLTRPIWGRYWRKREYAADAHAARLGQAQELAEFLETDALIHDHPVPYIWLTEHTHPPVELRIDRLLNTNEPTAPTQAGGEIAGRSEPVKGTPPGPPTAGTDVLPLTEP